jgi:ferredoxin
VKAWAELSLTLQIPKCEACVVACPTEAIVITTEEATSASAPAGMIVVEAGPVSPSPGRETAALPLRAKVLPVMGAALAWAGREIVPRLADHLLYSLDKWVQDRRAASSPGRTMSPRGQGRGNGGGGRRRQRRHRGQ